MPDLMEGRVAIVTGAGRGIGRSHARLLARRGCAVVVNDLGVDGEGCGSDPAVAQEVVDSIEAVGGRAVADCSDVADPAAAARLVDLALRTYGRIDAVINNAGIVWPRSFEETSLADCEKLWRIHFGGSFNVTQAAWPHFRRQKYGRVILTPSGAGLFGQTNATAYGSAKGAILGLNRTLALEGEPHGIVVNAVAPGAFTRMAEAALKNPEEINRARDHMSPDLVAPLVVWLASEGCQVTGQTFVAWAGRVARVGVGTGRGLVDREITPETIGQSYARIASLEEFHEPKDVLSDVAWWMSGGQPS
jgi:NAD(P)-dependent dehydrogenase (short-subunit alcohol dehydrogenase family)